MNPRNRPSPRPWKVGPHGPLEQLDENLWAIEGRFPEKPIILRRMHVARLSTGELVFHNAVPVDEAALAAIARLGTPRYLLIPSASHMLDAHPFRERLGLEVFCPRPITDQVQERVDVTGSYDQLPKDRHLTVHSLDGVRSGEAQIEVRSPDGARAHLLICDSVLNLPHLGGPIGWFMRLIGATGGPRVGPFFKWKEVTDKQALRAHFERLAQLPGLTSLVPSHGPIIREAPGASLREAAARM